jgi:hypothetical protein
VNHLESQIQEANSSSGGAHEERYAVVCVKNDAANTILEEVEISRAMFEIYEGGIVSFTNDYTVPILISGITALQFMHQGEAYIVSSSVISPSNGSLNCLLFT